MAVVTPATAKKSASTEGPTQKAEAAAGAVDLQRLGERLAAIVAERVAVATRTARHEVSEALLEAEQFERFETQVVRELDHLTERSVTEQRRILECLQAIEQRKRLEAAKATERRERLEALLQNVPECSDTRRRERLECLQETERYTKLEAAKATERREKFEGLLAGENGISSCTAEQVTTAAAVGIGAIAIMYALYAYR